MTDKKDVDIPKFGPDDVLKESLTKEELSGIAQMLAQQTVKVADSPAFVALIQKIRRIIEAM